jgi:hypothetical protein
MPPILQIYRSYQSPTNCCFSAHRFDFENKRITLEGRVPGIILSGDYEMGGSYLDYILYGNGTAVAVCRKSICSNINRYQCTFGVQYTFKLLPDTSDSCELNLPLPQVILPTSYMNMNATKDSLRSVPVALSTLSLIVKSWYVTN